MVYLVTQSLNVGYHPISHRNQMNILAVSHYLLSNTHTQDYYSWVTLTHNPTSSSSQKVTILQIRQCVSIVVFKYINNIDQ